VDAFERKHSLKSFMVAPTAIIAGLGKSLDIEVRVAEGATGDYKSNFYSKAKTCASILNDHDSLYEFAFLHIKAVDDAGHDKDARLKVKYIEKVDEMIGKLIELISSKSQIILVVTGDHSTPVRTGDHSFEPVPFVLAPLAGLSANHKKNDGEPDCKLLNLIRADTVCRFDENSASQGSLGRFAGAQVMPLVLKCSALLKQKCLL